MKPVFIGPRGLRAGWRLLIFLALVIVLLAGFVLVRSGGPQGLQAQRRLGPITITPLLLAESEAIAFLLICVATLIMGKLKHRRFGEYGLLMLEGLSHTEMAEVLGLTENNVAVRLTRTRKALKDALGVRP